jgi:hypothetical protein
MNALHNAIAYVLHNKFGNPPNMSRVEQHEYHCLLDARDELRKSQVALANANTGAPASAAYPKLLIGPEGKAERVTDAAGEAAARAVGYDYPPADPEPVAPATPATPAPLTADAPAPASEAVTAPAPAV